MYSVYWIDENFEPRLSYWGYNKDNAKARMYKLMNQGKKTLFESEEM